jgi:hypothetical protein
MKVEHQRHRALRERLRFEKRLTPQIAAQLQQPWRSNGVVVQVVFFFLTSLALLAFYGLCNLAGSRLEGVITGVIAVALAEYLIRVRGWFGTGVESALWIGGLIALITELPHSGRPEAVLVIGAAFAIAGARVRSPLFGAAAAIAVVQYFEARFDLGVFVALVLTVAALFALLRTWRRPSNEWLFIALAVILPLAGWHEADEVWRRGTIALFAIVAVIALTLAIRRPHHAYFVSGMIAAAIAATELGRMLSVVPLEARLGAGGAFLLATAALLSRMLRGRTRGFVLTPETLTPVDDELQLAATVTVGPDAPEPEPQPRGGGEFGGAGATGDF